MRPKGEPAGLLLRRFDPHPLIRHLVYRARHRAGLDQDSRGLYQYVVEDEIKPAAKPTNAQPGPRVIDLNDAPKVKVESRRR